MRKPGIAITGFMCSGKTTVARALAPLLHCEMVDLDESITASQQRTPQEIIEMDGEERFRETETRVLAELISNTPAQMIALGGGTWTIERNRALLAEHGYLTVWLDAPFELCWRRIEASVEQRPLARSYEAAKQRYLERLEIYQFADYRVEVSESETAEHIANGIAALVLRGGANS